jgi:protein O-GlcNAc transferase
VYFRIQRYADAAASLKTAVRLRPNYAEAHFNLAVAYVALKDRKGALDEYNTLRTLDPKLADAFFQRFLKK